MAYTRTGELGPAVSQPQGTQEQQAQQVEQGGQIEEELERQERPQEQARWPQAVFSLLPANILYHLLFGFKSSSTGFLRAPSFTLLAL